MKEKNEAIYENIPNVSFCDTIGIDQLCAEMIIFKPSSAFAGSSLR